jgi:cytochrome c oxidase cbb3-type subunit III
VVLRIAGLLLVGAGIAAPFLLSQQRSSRSPQTNPAAQSVEGQQIFASNCAACHGLDGRGGERAPNIATVPRVQRLSDNEVMRIVSDGVPGTGMPGFHNLTPPEIKAVIGHLRVLQGKNGSAPLPGNPQRGKAIFFGSAGCSSCHMIGGSGGFIASDLTSYGRTHAADKIRGAITGVANRESSRGAVTATTTDGKQYRGMVRNEDNFSLQLQSMDGSFHFFSKASLKKIEREPGSIMPSDYGSKLNDEQLNDLVSYLLSIGNTSTPAPARAEDDQE